MPTKLHGKLKYKPLTHHINIPGSCISFKGIYIGSVDFGDVTVRYYAIKYRKSGSKGYVTAYQVNGKDMADFVIVFETADELYKKSGEWLIPFDDIGKTIDELNKLLETADPAIRQNL